MRRIEKTEKIPNAAFTDRNCEGKTMRSIREVKTIDSLIDYLEKKGENHTYYYHYTSWDSFVKIYNSRSFLLTRGNSLAINDQHESLMKGSWKIWNKTYIGSFAFGASENMAMWGLYGLPWEDAVRIVIPKENMLYWIKSISSVLLWDNGEKGIITDPKISLADIVYVSGIKNGDDLKLTHNDKSFTTIHLPKLHGLDTDPKMTGYIKNYAWHYENEVRIRVELPKDTGYEKILLNIPSKTVDAFQITTGPYFRWKDNKLYEQLCHQNRVNESGFKNLVRYRAICSMCQHESFLRK